MLVYDGDSQKGIYAYTNSDWAADKIKCQPITGYFFKLANGIFSLLDGDRTSHPNMVRIPDVHNISHVPAPAAYYNGNCTHIHPWVSYIYEIQLHNRTGLIAQLVEHLSMNAGGLRFNP